MLICLLFFGVYVFQLAAYGILSYNVQPLADTVCHLRVLQIAQVRDNMGKIVLILAELHLLAGKYPRRNVIFPLLFSYNS